MFGFVESAYVVKVEFVEFLQFFNFALQLSDATFQRFDVQFGSFLFPLLPGHADTPTFADALQPLQLVGGIVAGVALFEVLPGNGDELDGVAGLFEGEDFPVLDRFKQLEEGAVLRKGVAGERKKALILHYQLVSLTIIMLCHHSVIQFPIIIEGWRPQCGSTSLGR